MSNKIEINQRESEWDKLAVGGIELLAGAAMFPEAKLIGALAMLVGFRTLTK